MFIMILIVLYWILKINYSLIYIKEYKKLKSGLNYKEIVEKLKSKAQGDVNP